jgi:hypothetical protein
MDPCLFHPWYPKGVRDFVATIFSYYIAHFTDDTVLKYPVVPPNEKDICTPKGLQFRTNLRKTAVENLQVK